MASDPPVAKCPVVSPGNEARRATARITWLSRATGAGEEAELASCGLKSGGDVVRTLRGKGRPRIEQAEVAGIGHLDDAVLQALDRPLQQLLERPRRLEIHSLELRPVAGHVEGRDHRARLEVGECALQLPRQPGLDASPLGSAREQRRDGWG